MKTVAVGPQQIREVHQLYCELTGQNLSLGFDRERMWYELLRLGHGPEQIQKVIRYLQREIRETRRNVGAFPICSSPIASRRTSTSVRFDSGPSPLQNQRPLHFQPHLHPTRKRCAKLWKTGKT